MRTLVLASFLVCARIACAVTLGTGAGDGQVVIDIDPYGSFGYEAAGSGTGDATYDPVGAVGPSSTTWESAVYFRQTGSSRFLTTGLVGTTGESGQLPDVGFGASDATTATSAFTYAGLQFALEQRVEDAFDGGVRVGSVLTQTYTITNPGGTPEVFDLVRYYEGDLALGGAGVPDGGGHIFFGSTEYVFQTDVAGQPADSTNFVGITAVGGTIPTSGRFEVGLWPGFPARIAADMPLADAVHNDGPDADEFVDAGMAFDAGIALANHFDLGAGQQAVYVTTTRFGTGAPVDVGVPTTTTTVATPATTTTTLPGVCTVEPTFASILCRLDALIADVNTSGDLGKFKGGLARQLGRARKRTVQASGRVDAGKARTARGPLRDAIQAVGAFIHRLNSNNVRKKVGAPIRATLTDGAGPIQADMRTLYGGLKSQH